MCCNDDMPLTKCVIHVPVGMERVVQTWVHESRTLPQFSTVQAITENPTFDFSCNSSPFDPQVGAYHGPFCFVYYTKDGALNVDRIGTRGQILRHINGVRFSGKPKPKVMTPLERIVEMTRCMRSNREIADSFRANYGDVAVETLVAEFRAFLEEHKKFIPGCPLMTPYTLEEITAKRSI